MPFGVEKPAHFWVISVDLEENISTPSRRLTSEDQCLSFELINSGIYFAWDVCSRPWKIRREKLSDSFSYSGI